MKKIITLALAAIMALSATATAFAVDSTEINPDGEPQNPDSAVEIVGIDQDSEKQYADTAVTFTVDPTFIIIIPATVELIETPEYDTEGNLTAITYENDLTVSAESVRLPENQAISVTLDSDFELEDDQNPSNTLPYTVSVGDQEITADNAEVALFGTSKTEQTSVLHFAAENPEYAGTYSDTVTFYLDLAGLPVEEVEDEIQAER